MQKTKNEKKKAVLHAVFFFSVFVISGDGCHREDRGGTAALHPPEKSALGEGMGGRGKGNTLPRERRGVPLPQVISSSDHP